MKGEIDKDFYCSANRYENRICDAAGHARYKCEKRDAYGNDCGCCHRKWPTPEQFEEEYGEKYTLERPVWLLVSYAGIGDWETKSFYEALKRINDIKDINGWTYSLVCACTHFGKPDKDWRPE